MRSGLGISGLGASLELEYVLAVPPERAAEIKDELLRSGVPDGQIIVTEPGCRTLAVAENATRGRGQRDGRWFMPGHIKLGTYVGGLYKVVMRRRTAPECRETLWITMTADRVARKKRLAAADNDVDRGTLTIQRCICDVAGCDDRRNALRKYLAADTEENGNPATCVYERITNALSVRSGTSEAAVSAKCAEPADAADDVDVTVSGSGDDDRISVGSDHHTTTRHAPPSPPQPDVAGAEVVSGRVRTPSSDHPPSARSLADPDRVPLTSDCRPLRVNAASQMDQNHDGDGDRTAAAAGPGGAVEQPLPGSASAPTLRRRPCKISMFGRLKFWNTSKPPVVRQLRSATANPPPVDEIGNQDIEKKKQ